MTPLPTLRCPETSPELRRQAESSLARPPRRQVGVYFLVGSDPASEVSQAVIEASNSMTLWVAMLWIRYGSRLSSVSRDLRLYRERAAR
jgi:hypothetical protein